MKRTIILFFILLLPVVTQAAGVLRLMMPDDTIAYIRLLGSGDFNGAAPGTRLQRAMSAAGKDLNLSQRLLAGVEKDKELQVEAPWLEAFYRLSAPVEAVVLAPQDNKIQSIKLLLRSRLDADNIREVDALLQRLLSSYSPELTLVSAMDANGVAVLSWEKTLTVVLKFNPSNQSMYLLAGLNANRATLSSVLASMKIVDKHPMHALERQADDSTQGVFAWVDVPRVMQLVSALNPDPMLNAQLAAFKGVRGVAMGWGSRDGKGRLSLIVDAPKAASLNRMLPTIVNDYSLTARGDLGLLFSLNLPGPMLLKMGEGMLSRDPQEFAEYQENKKKFTRLVGMSPEQLLATFGPEMLVLGDSAGTFFAIRVSDQQGLQQLLKNLSENPNLEYEARELKGHNYHHLAFSLIPADDMSRSPTDTALETYFVNMYLSSKTHLYWTQEDDWLLFSQVPQSLFDRHNDTRVVSVTDWLLTKQRQRAQNALLLLSIEQDQMPRSLYHAYLMVLESVADMAGTKADLLSLPGARELQLPVVGSYGLQLDLGDPYLRLEATFEANPFEMLLNGNPMTTVATVGILAAIAVPAYEDYLTRAQLAQIFARMGSAKAAIEAFYSSNGYAPSDAESAGLGKIFSDDASGLLSDVKVIDGVIVFTFGNKANSQITGRTLRLTPYVSAENPAQVIWRCGNASLQSRRLHPLPTKAGESAAFVASTLPHKYLPENCR